MRSEYYLKPTVQAEPLIWQWYAWSHLIAPATAACNIVDRHIRIMKSYVQSPQFHAEAVNNPKLLGGPFIDLMGQQVDEVKQLLEQTQKNCELLIQLMADLRDLDTLVQTNVDGSSLESLYAHIPNSLKGMIELVYDSNHHAALRLIEPIFYQRYYCDKYQSIALSEGDTDNRPFIMSTPRLAKDSELTVALPFSDSRYDKLFAMRHTPQCYEEIKEQLAIPAEKEALFRSFFTETPPTLSSKREYVGEGVRVRYFGHACVLLQTKRITILIDPVVSYPYEGQVPRYTFNDLPESIDYVLLTHNHQDHVLFETLLQLRHKIHHIVFPNSNKGALIDPSLKLILKQIGFINLIGIDEFEQQTITDGFIMGLPFLGEHSDLNVQTKTAYFIQLKDQRFLFAADSNNLDGTLYEHIFRHTGPIDTLFIGMECDGAPLSWLYGPLLTKPMKRSHDKSRSLSGSNFEKAWPIVQLSRCKRAYVYAMGQEPWLNYVMALKYTPESIQMIESNRLIEACRAVNIESERLFGKKEWLFS